MDNMALSPSLGDAERQGSHFVSGGGQKVAVVSRHTRACPLVPPTMSSRRRRRRFLSALRFVSPKRRRGERRRTPLPRPTGSPLPSPYATDSPPRVHDFPTSGDPTTFPFVPAAPSGRRRRRRGETLPFPLAPSSPSPATADTATTIVFSSDSLPPPTATIPPILPSRDIITPFYSRFIGLYQLHCHRTVCIVAAWLPDCCDRVAHVLVPRLRSTAGRFSPPRDAPGTACPRKSAPVVYRRRPTENRRTELLPLSRRVVRRSAMGASNCAL